MRSRPTDGTPDPARDRTERGSTATRPGPSSAPSWHRWWEATVESAHHADLACLLTRSFPTTVAFARGRSWAGARPELRVVGWLQGRPVAHAGVIRRFVRATDRDTSTLVGDVGLVAVDPNHRGIGLGAALLAAVADTLAHLELPYGFLTCGPDVRRFYERSGWTALDDRPLRSITIHNRVHDHGRNAMLLPVLARGGDWPSGPIQRDGQEI